VILLIDNYDSFVHNLARHVQRLGQDTLVLRNDAVDAEAIGRLRPAAVVLSPGPCTPATAGCSLDVVRRWYDRLPMLGVCLGHQAIAQALGGRVVRAPTPFHGRASPVLHIGDGVFAGLPSPMAVGRYHSLVVDPTCVGTDLVVAANTPDGVVMALAHRRYPVVGVQFHPESILTEHGYRLLANFLCMAGLAVPATLPSHADEVLLPSDPPLPASVLTF
jgi:anthranilate synthase/aminodeoxychorismate synthase-like glutamine amidotransferase